LKKCTKLSKITINIKKGIEKKMEKNIETMSNIVFL